MVLELIVLVLEKAETTTLAALDRRCTSRQGQPPEEEDLMVVAVSVMGGLWHSPLLHTNQRATVTSTTSRTANDHPPLTTADGGGRPRWMDDTGLALEIHSLGGRGRSSCLLVVVVVVQCGIGGRRCCRCSGTTRTMMGRLP